MLSNRQLLILQAIINGYIKSAEPVGSRSISQEKSISYSPATIRNEMADLEELGFLEKTHSSSGRVPSEKGYRHYVDHLLLPHHFSKNEVTNMKSLFEEKILEADQAVKHSATILSELTSYVSIVLGPKMFDAKLKSIQVIPLREDAAVAILVTDTGHVENKAVSLPAGLSSSDLEKMVNILNEKLSGVPLYLLEQKMATEITVLMKQHIDNYAEALLFAEDTLKKSSNEKVYYGGKTNLLNQPEFKDIAKVKSLYELFEKEDMMHELLKPNKSGLSIRIGQENENAAFEHCSIISATYSFNGRAVGTIGIVGPKRMEYPKVISLIQHISHDLEDILKNLYRTDA